MQELAKRVLADFKRASQALGLDLMNHQPEARRGMFEQSFGKTLEAVVEERQKRTGQTPDDAEGAAGDRVDWDADVGALGKQKQKLLDGLTLPLLFAPLLRGRA